VFGERWSVLFLRDIVFGDRRNFRELEAAEKRKYPRRPTQATRRCGSGSGWPARGLVALGGVEDQFAEEFAGGGVDDADVELLDQDEDMGCGVGSSDADGVELSLEARVDLACLVDAVAA